MDKTSLKIGYLRELQHLIELESLELSAKALFLKSAAAVCVSIEEDFGLRTSPDAQNGTCEAL